ncbi:MAG: hypothetical protein AAF682_22330 [Planctomycetota bacterium]
MRPLHHAALTLLLAAAASCGSSSEPADSQGGEGAGEGQASPAEDADGFRFTGTVQLDGDLASRKYGYVFISVKPTDVVMPSYSRKYSFEDAEVDAPGSEPRLLRFEINESHRMGGLGPGDHVLEAWFDPDGFVETKEGGARETVPVGRGQDGIKVAVRLDPAE